jgi:hypothetical protein
MSSFSLGINVCLAERDMRFKRESLDADTVAGQFVKLTHNLLQKVS